MKRSERSSTDRRAPSPPLPPSSRRSPSSSKRSPLLLQEVAILFEGVRASLARGRDPLRRGPGSLGERSRFLFEGVRAPLARGRHPLRRGTHSPCKKRRSSSKRCCDSFKEEPNRLLGASSSSFPTGRRPAILRSSNPQAPKDHPVRLFLARRCPFGQLYRVAIRFSLRPDAHATMRLRVGQ